MKCLAAVVVNLAWLAVAAGAEAPEFTVSAPPQVKLGDPIIITVQVTKPTTGTVLFYRVKNQSRASAAITLVKDPTLQTVCYVWAQPARYEIEVECVVKTDAEARATKPISLQVYVDPELPKLPPLGDEPKPPENPPIDPPKPPETPTAPRPPPEQPKPPTDGDLGGLFGLGPKIRDKINELVPEQFRDKATGLAGVYRIIANEVADPNGKIKTPADAQKRIRELSGQVLKTPEDRAAWKPFNDWLGGELAKLTAPGRIKEFRDIVTGLAEISLGFFLSTAGEVP